MEMNENKKLNFVFFGTPDVASETLEILKAHGYVPSLIVTSPDRPVGRHFTMTPSPTKIWADENNIPTLQPEKITDEVIEHLQSHPPNPLPQGKGAAPFTIRSGISFFNISKKTACNSSMRLHSWSEFFLASSSAFVNPIICARSSVPDRNPNS